nr:archaeosortase/exosortase family protein [Methylocaldum marinum]
MPILGRIIAWPSATGRILSFASIVMLPMIRALPKYLCRAAGFRHLGLPLRFLLLYGGLQWLYQDARGGALERLLIDTLTVRPSAALIDWLTPGERVIAEGHRLVSPWARLNVLNGCEGTETVLLLGAALLVFPARLRHKLQGLLGGSLLIYTLNQTRIVGLYYALRHDRDSFQLLHGVLAPTLIILAASLFFLVWAKQARSTPEATTGKAGCGP